MKINLKKVISYELLENEILYEKPEYDGVTFNDCGEYIDNSDRFVYSEPVILFYMQDGSIERRFFKKIEDIRDFENKHLKNKFI